MTAAAPAIPEGKVIATSRGHEWVRDVTTRNRAAVVCRRCGTRLTYGALDEACKRRNRQ